MSSDDKEVFSNDSLEDSSGSDVGLTIWKSSLTVILVMKINGFGFNIPENIQWTQAWYKKDASDFQLTSGPTRNLLDSSTAANYFDVFIDQQTINDIVLSTNQNAVVKAVGNWEPVLREEMKAFIAMWIIVFSFIEHKS